MFFKNFKEQNILVFKIKLVEICFFKKSLKVFLYLNYLKIKELFVDYKKILTKIFTFINIKNLIFKLIFLTFFKQ